MMNGYQDAIRKAAKLTTGKDVLDTEELMRQRTGGCLDALDSRTFNRYARDAWGDVQACRAEGIEII
jgi:hypothetical protein